MTSRALRAALLLPLLALLAVAPAPQQPKKKLQPDTLEHFEEFCRRFLVLDNHQPFLLEAFQRLILRGFFAGVTEVLILLPKKNGKTTLLAALALYHLIYTPDAACYIAASARDQAKILYDQACGFVERKDPLTGALLPQAAALQKRLQLRRGTKEIRSRRDSGFIWVLSGDKDTADGVIPTLALVDELHRHKDNGALYGVLHDGLGPRNGRIVTISTAGERLKSALGRIRAAALRMPGLRREGAYAHVSSPDGQFELHEFSLDPEADREDLDLVKQANPLRSNTIEKLRQRKQSPTMTPSRWARFACGVWMQGEDAAVGALDWARCAKPGLTLERGSEVWLGLDIGWRWDTTVVVPFQPIDQERGRFGTPKILVPPRDGTSLLRSAVIAAVLYFRDELGLEIRAVVFDRNAEGESVAQELEDEHGIEIVEHSQDASLMADASMGLTEAIGQQHIEQPDDDEFSSHVLAARAKTVSGDRWRFDAPTENRGQRKQGVQESNDIEVVDGAIAGAMVHHSAMAAGRVVEDDDPFVEVVSV